MQPANLLRSASLVCTVLATNLLASNVMGQTFPAKPVRSVSPYSAGSGPDAVMRVLSEKLTRTWGHQLVVDNKPGASGFIAIGEVKRAAPDGYTLLQVDNTHMALQPHVFKQLPYDPVKDFEPVAPLYSTHFFIVVAANSPINADVSKLLETADVRERLSTFGFEPWIGAPAELTKAIERDSRRFGEVVKRAKISLD